MSLILLPTRELAVQVESVLKTVTNRLKTFSDARISTCTISGGFSVEKQIRMLASNPKIVIATIGRLWDILQNGKSEDVKKITGSQFLILDEVDRIIDLGQMKDLENVLKFIDDPYNLFTQQVSPRHQHREVRSRVPPGRLRRGQK